MNNISGGVTPERWLQPFFPMFYNNYGGATTFYDALAPSRTYD